ncbi:MAG: alpha-1,2-fucosyltransferase [Opitutales bacterium]|nr:alpha-1,2-fucosyltransferase [Opitutales bacterium]
MTQNRPTIRMLLCGGLGNQLFQYAFARALALRSKAHLELDAASLFAKDKVYQRNYELDAFTIPESVRVIRKRPAFSDLRRKWAERKSRGKSLETSQFVTEPQPFQFYPEYAQWRVSRNILLLGYWQCEDYFKDAEVDIRRYLTFREPIHPQHVELAKQIESCESVAVHIRRVQYKRAISIDYYQKGLLEMRHKLDNPRFFVFTDDPEGYANDGLEGDDIQLIPSTGLPAIEDFKLMAHNRHFIIANSSFSWWAAWLGNQQGTSYVIAPISSVWSNKAVVPDKWQATQAQISKK